MIEREAWRNDKIRGKQNKSIIAQFTWNRKRLEKWDVSMQEKWNENKNIRKTYFTAIHGYENRIKLGTLKKLVCCNYYWNELYNFSFFLISIFLLLDVSSPRIAFSNPLVDFLLPRSAVWIARAHANVFYIRYHFLKLLDSETHSLLQAKVISILFFLEQLDVDVCKTTVFTGVCGHADKSFIRCCHVIMGISKVEIFWGCEWAESHGWFLIYFDWWLCCATGDLKTKVWTKLPDKIKDTWSKPKLNDIWHNRELVADKTMFIRHKILTLPKWLRFFPLLNLMNVLKQDTNAWNRTETSKFKTLSFASSS